MKTHKKLFGNVGGNQFKLLTEGVAVQNNKPEGAELVREGLKKVFSNGGKTISYKNMASVGLGYIKDVTEATKCALNEAKELAEEFGYRADDDTNRFIKENDFTQLDAQDPSSAGAKKTPHEMGHEEGDMVNSEEKAEIRIGNEILELAEQSQQNGDNHSAMVSIMALAQELLRLHGGA